MPRLFSASVDEALPSTEILCAKEAYLNRLSHAASAIELRATRRSNAHSAGPRKRKGRRFLRAVSSFPLSETTHNARKDVSRSSNSNSEDRFSMCMTDYDGSCSSTSDLETDTAAKNYPSPPASDDGSPSEPSKESHASQPVDTFPFPLNPVPISVSSKFVGSRNDVLQTPTRRRTSAELSYRTPSRSPDRFISNRQSPQDPAKTFRLSKSPKRLSSLERLRRHKSATPDPFDPLNVRRLREGRIALPVYGNAHATTSRSRTIGTTSVSHPPQDPLATQNRQASAGAVWNVGGNALADHSHPIRNVSDGRGGFISSGSNAPMYSSHFLDDDTMEDDTNQMESRLAAALDIDQITKVLDISRGPNPSRTLSTSSFGKKRRYSYVEPRTRWIQGEWVKERSQSLLDAPSLRDDYYCTVLAYCRIARVLAVGLGNRVYLWSETLGVRYPPDDPNARDSTYVTSLAFSSTEGGHSILAIGRNSGQISLWSLHDPDNIRFQSRQPCAIACVAFKPVTTRRPSERSGCTMTTEELLVGDEVGNVYYYSVEWISKQQVDIHGWTGAMNLMAKISVHSQQLCGLAWSSDGEYFATGANDNACCLFEVKDVLRPSDTPPETSPYFRRPLQTIIGGFGLPNILARTHSHSEIMGVLANGVHVQRTRVIPGQYGSLLIGEGRQKHKWLHSAAIKAIAFCPWQRGLLATGGGSNDRAIHFYHTFSGACLATINVYAQVTSLIWSTTRREIAATFGYAQPDHPYRIAVFSWPECRQVVAIPWQSDMRALYAISYPGGPGETTSGTSMGERWCSRTRDEGCIVVACSDESVKFHEVWSGTTKSTGVHIGLLGGSDILEGLEGIDKEEAEVIR